MNDVRVRVALDGTERAGRSERDGRWDEDCVTPGFDR